MPERRRNPHTVTWQPHRRSSITARENAAQALTCQTFDPLLEFTSPTTNSSRLLPPAGASRMTASSTRSNLHEGVTWHDGVPFTADRRLHLRAVITNPRHERDSAQFNYTFEARRARSRSRRRRAHRGVPAPAPSAAFLLNLRAFYGCRSKAGERRRRRGDASTAPADPVRSATWWAPVPSCTTTTWRGLVSLKRNPNYGRSTRPEPRFPTSRTSSTWGRWTEAQTAQLLAGTRRLQTSRRPVPELQGAGARRCRLHMVVTRRVRLARPISPSTSTTRNSGSLLRTDFRRAMEYAVDRERVIERLQRLATYLARLTAPAHGAFY